MLKYTLNQKNSSTEVLEAISKGPPLIIKIGAPAMLEKSFDPESIF
jgi:hypothetical protein